MLEKVFRRLASMSEKRPWLVILMVLLFTAIALVGITRIKREFGYRSMLPKSVESVKALDKANEIFGGTTEEEIMLEGDDLLNGTVVRKVAGFPAYIQGNGELWDKFVTEITTPLDEMVYYPAEEWLPSEESLLEKVGDLSDEELSRQVKLNIDFAKQRAEKLGLPGSGVQDISQDGKAMLIRAKINPDTKTGEQIKLVEPFETTTREYFSDLSGLSLYETGMASQNRDSNAKTMRETRLLFMLALIFILLVLYLTFRRISDVMLTMTVILVTIIWVLGLSGWLRFPFTYTSVAIMPLMLGIDIAYAIHVMSRYYEERRKGADPYKSVVASVITVGVAVFLTAATTAFGFASFGISNLPPIQQFGALCVAGVMFSFLLAVTMLPAAVVLRDRGKKAQEKWDRKNKKRMDRPEETRLDKFLARIAILSEHHRALVGMVTLAIIVACIVLGFNISSEADLSSMMPKDTPSAIASDEINNIFGGQNIAFALVEGDILEPFNLESMLKYEEAISSTSYTTHNGDPIILREKVVSIADIVYGANNGSIPSSKGEVVSSLLKLQSSSKTGSRLRLISQDGQVAMISVRVSRGTQTDMKHVADIMRDSRKMITNDDSSISMSYSGMPILMIDLMGSIVPTQLKTSGLALILCALIVILTFNSLFFGLAATSVVFISIAMEIGALVLLGWPLDFMTVMVSSLVIGAGIDFGIHVSHRFREEWHHGGVDIDEAIRRTIDNVGRALLAAAVTTAGAFAIIAVSDITPLRRFGGITALSLTFSLLSSLLVLPSILAWRASRVERKGDKKLGS
jgi:predicted RND superfamily exporter protein